MIEERKKEITENLISSFHEAGNISLELRKKGLKKRNKKRQYTSYQWRY